MHRRLDPSARIQCLLFGLTLALYLITLYPTFYTFDSAELAIGAAKLGIVHSPGYALYLLVAHAFTWLPLGDIGFRLNLLSALATALTVPILWTCLTRLTGHRAASALAALCFALNPTVWHNGTITEVYATQTLTLVVTLWTLLHLRAERTLGRSLVAGGAFGIAVAMHPSSALFAPVMALAFAALRMRLTRCLAAGALAAALVLVTLPYFPLRQAASPPMNFAGRYVSSGQFEQVDLRTAEGLLWMLRGGQFDDLFFAEGLLPSTGQLVAAAITFGGNLQVIGLLLGLPGLLALVHERWTLAVWLAAFLPYLYFYTTYGAIDRAFMFGPVYLLWSVPLAYGLAACAARLRPPARVLLLALPMLMAVAGLAFVSGRDDVRTEAASVMGALPPESLVFGVWGDVVTLEYLHLLEGQRPDVTLRNLFFFDDAESILAHIRLETAARPGRPLVFLSNLVPTGLDARAYTILPLRVGSQSRGFIFMPR